MIKPMEAADPIPNVFVIQPAGGWTFAWGNPYVLMERGAIAKPIQLSRERSRDRDCAFWRTKLLQLCTIIIELGDESKEGGRTLGDRLPGGLI